MRLHIDTDFGGDPDDACALAMLAGWPGVEITGITTTADPDGRRAGYVVALLELLGQDEVPVVAGVARSLTTGLPMGEVADHRRYWPGLPEPARGAPVPGAASGLLARSIAAGATLVAIGPYTNLALLEQARPGALAGTRVVTMGGWASDFGEGYPQWGPERDHNVVCDTDAALAVFASAADVTVVPCAAAVDACLRTADLPRLGASGTVGALLARQSRLHGREHGYADLAAMHPALPDDLVNFHWDPVTCAVALGWPGARVEHRTLWPVVEDGALRLRRDPAGRRTAVVTGVDGVGFATVWLDAVEAAQAPHGPAAGRVRHRMSQLPNGEHVENIEDLSTADMADRIDKDPEEYRNREEMSDPDNTEDGADGR